jgi:hypothetical protein
MREFSRMDVAKLLSGKWWGNGVWGNAVSLDGEDSS